MRVSRNSHPKVPSMRSFPFVFALLLCGSSLVIPAETSAQEKPNILFCIADDWGWPHAGSYGDQVVQTPTFDRLADEGVLFENAFVSSPSCTPSRGAILTGQWHWRLKNNANLHSTLPKEFPVYPELLQERGYHIGAKGKAWGPGNLSEGGRTSRPAGPHVKSLATFLDEKPAEAPFCFWLGTSDPHRPYKKGSGRMAGIDIDKVHVPAFYPNDEEIRSDIADYYFEVQRFDTLVGKALAEVEKRGLLENTIVVMTGDHGMPFPRCKSNLYDWGTRVPLAVRWGKQVPAGRRVTDFVSLTDLAPTFLTAAGVDVPDQMTGRDLLPVLTSDKGGRVDAAHDAIVFGKERHTPCQDYPSIEGTPCRAIRTDDFLYIINFKPDLWPAGTPGKDLRGTPYGDCDNSPTKSYLLERKDDPAYAKYYELAFAKRPGEELYVLASDPDQIENVADDPQYAAQKEKLRERLMKVLRETEDPRAVGGGDEFPKYRYWGRLKNTPDFWKKKDEK